MSADPDVVVVGAGPNGLTAACVLAEAGLRVLVLEANDTVGGAVRSGEVTLPGFQHDLYSAFYPLSVVGPIGDLPLDQHGLRWCHSERPYGGGSERGPGVAVERSLEASVARFEAAQPGDGAGWRELFDWWRWGGQALIDLLFHPIGDPAGVLRGATLLRSPQRLFEFSQLMVGSARAMVDRFFRGDDARVWLNGSVLHSDLVPNDAGGGAFGLLLCGLSQQIGMPIVQGGAQGMTDALVSLLRARGGDVRTGQRVQRLVVRRGRAVAVQTQTDEIRVGRAVLATAQPQALFLRLLDEGDLPPGFVRLVRRYRWGTGVYVLHCALSEPPPYRSELLRGTLVVHLARDMAELDRAATGPRRGELPEHPLLIAGVHTLADPSRAPAGQHTLWAMTHVPSRIERDQAGRIGPIDWRDAKEPFQERLLDEIEAYAPGFRRTVLGAAGQTPPELEQANANLVGGDIGTGSYTLDQQMVFRPFPGWFRYRTPVDGLYISGAATHPGGGAHGGAGANAARVMLADLRLARLREQVGDGLSRARARLLGA